MQPSEPAAYETLTTDALLAGLATTEVLPGVHRIDKDGERKPRLVTDVQVTSDGRVWVLADGRLYALGGDELPQPPAGHTYFHMRDDGTAAATGYGTNLEGRTWDDVQRTSWFDGQVWHRVAEHSLGPDLHLTAHGVLWAQTPEGLGRYGDGGWTVVDWPVEVEQEGDILHFVEAPDGTLYAAQTSMGEHVGPGVLWLDEDQWRSLPPPAGWEPAEELHASALAVGPDGSLWAELYGHDHDAVGLETVSTSTGRTSPAGTAPSGRSIRPGTSSPCQGSRSHRTGRSGPSPAAARCCASTARRGPGSPCRYGCHASPSRRTELSGWHAITVGSSS